LLEWWSAIAPKQGQAVERTLSGPRGRLLERYSEWLATEGVAAGLLSPTETTRIDSRHVADSLSFLAGWPEETPGRLFDAGSGGGLPGIPLGIALPDTEVVLVERSESRSILLRRAIRMLQLDNVSVATRDVGTLRTCEAVVMRAVFSPREAVDWMSAVLAMGGLGVLALARSVIRRPDWDRLGGEVVEVGVLDPPGWLLMIRNRGE